MFLKIIFDLQYNFIKEAKEEIILFHEADT